MLMLAWKTRLAMFIVIGAAAIGGSLVLAQNFGPGPTASPAPGQPQVKEPPYKNPDQRLAEAGAAVSGFGGAYLDPEDNGIAYVYMLDTSQQEEARRALEKYGGAERVAREIREIRLLQGQYSMADLSRWYQPLRMFWTEGVNTTDLAEHKNRILIRVLDEQTKARVEAEIDRLGIPRAAVEFEVGPVTFTFTNDVTLNSQANPWGAASKLPYPDPQA